jgi:hypothetical protein
LKLPSAPRESLKGFNYRAQVVDKRGDQRALDIIVGHDSHNLLVVALGRQPLRTRNIF